MNKVDTALLNYFKMKITFNATLAFVFEIHFITPFYANASITNKETD